MYETKGFGGMKMLAVLEFDGTDSDSNILAENTSLIPRPVGVQLTVEEVNI